MKITIVDSSKYKSKTCCNYSFTETYISRGDGNFEVLHSTSLECPYCPLCGSFYSGEDCSCGMKEPDVVDIKTVNKEICCAMRRFAQGEEWEIIIEE